MMDNLLNRKCSFCKKNGHTIHSCDSSVITEFKETCLLKASEFNFYENTDQIKWNYMGWLRLQNKKLIKALALNLLLISTSNRRVRIYINRLTTHFLIHERKRQELNNNFNCELNVQVRNFINSQEMDIQSQIMRFINSQEENSIQNMYQLVFDTFMNPNNQTTQVFYSILKEIDTYIDCNICYEHTPLNLMATYNCGHSFCGVCTEKYIVSLSLDTVMNCAMCRSKIEKIHTPYIYIYRNIKQALKTRETMNGV
jgi:hypothetical protein